MSLEIVHGKTSDVVNLTRTIRQANGDVVYLEPAITVELVTRLNKRTASVIGGYLVDPFQGIVGADVDLSSYQAGDQIDYEFRLTSTDWQMTAPSEGIAGIIRVEEALDA